MLRRVFAPALLGLGVVVIALAIASATLWRPADHLSATATGSSGTSYLVTEPGLLDLAADEVAVDVVSASGARVVVALATSADIDAWLGENSSTRVTGLARVERTEVLTSETRGSSAPEGVDPTGSDLWRWDRTGTGRVAFDWDREPGRLGLIVWSAADDATDVTLTLTWPQVVRTPWLVPGVVLGSVLLLAGLGLLALRIRRARAERERRASLEVTAELAAVSTAPLTRRQLREAQALAEGRTPTGSQPALSVASERPDVERPQPGTVVVVPIEVDAATAEPTGPTGPAEPDRDGSAGTGEGARPLTRRERRLAAEAASRPDPAPATEMVPVAPAAPVPEGAAPKATVPVATATVPTTAVPATAAPDGAAPPSAVPAARPRKGVLGRWRRPEPVVEPEPEPEPAAEWYPDPTPTSASSADAWRRAWGFPGTTAAGAADAADEDSITEDTTTEEGAR